MNELYDIKDYVLIDFLNSLKRDYGSDVDYLSLSETEIFDKIQDQKPEIISVFIKLINEINNRRLLG